MKFAVLFSIQMEHEYRSNSTATGLTLLPTAQTALQMKRLGWLFREQRGGALVAAETKAGSNVLLVPPPPKMALRFWLVLNDPLFVNYTDLPETAKKGILFFTNRTSTDTSGLLHQATTVNANDVLPFPVLQPAFATNDTGKLVLRDAADQLIYETTTTPPKTYTTLSATDEGWCSAEINGEKQSPFSIGVPPMGANVKGLVEIWYDTTLPAEQTYISSATEALSVTYTIRFAARSALWKYLITGSNLDNYQSLAVTDARRSVFFTGPETVSLMSGSKALAFTSPEPIRFSDKQNLSFQLRRNCTPGGNAGSPLIDRLPHPAPDLLHHNSSNYYSEIIIHL